MEPRKTVIFLSGFSLAAKCQLISQSLEPGQVTCPFVPVCWFGKSQLAKSLAGELLHERLGERSPVPEKALLRFRLPSGVIGDGGALHHTNVVGDLQEPARSMVGIAKVGDIPGEHEVECVMQGYAHGTLTVVVIDGYGIEDLEK